MLTTILLFAVIIVLVIFVHEFGHFIVAKLMGMKVEEFGFGFPPAIFKIKKGETTYSLNALPLGGFVKILGEDGDSKNPRSFSEKKALPRIAVLVAGVLMNFLLAIILLTICYSVGVTPLTLNPKDLKGTKTSEVLIADVIKDSAAQKSGLQVGDEVKGFSSVADFQNFTKANAGKEVQMNIRRDGQDITKAITLNSGDSPLGVAIFEISTVKQSVPMAFISATKDTYSSSVLIVKVLGKALKQLVVSGTASDEIKQTTGPIGLYKLSGEVAKLGVVYFLQFIALLSINLGLINILPFPALDGGRVVFVALEGIFKKKVIKQQIETMIHTIGFALLIILIILITIRDVVRYY